MSYLDQTSRRRPVTIAAVTLVHLGIGYAIVSGLAITVISHIPIVTQTSIYKDPETPPPHDLPPRTASAPRPTAPDPVVRPLETVTQTIDVRPTFETKIDPVGPQPLPPPPLPRPDLTRAVQPGPGRAGWVTTEDYPAQPLREGISGVVAISVQIAADGRVEGCTVTKSSGNAQLDDATCRLYARRAHFQPALDADGTPVASVHTDRIRWELPQE